MKPVVLTKSEARDFLTGHHALRETLGSGTRSLSRLLTRLKCVQLDPLDVIGTNADLVALARVDNIKTGDIYRALYPGRAFEHFAKERCLLPAEAFPWYRDRAAETPWWRLSERLKRLPKGVVESVLDEIREKGPLTCRKLTSRGRVAPLDWNGWKGTANASRMAIEVLWTRCQIVVAGREGGEKVYDVPERALPKVAQLPSGEFERWALLQRVEAAGLLARAGGPVWSMLSEARVSRLPEQLVEEGLLEQVVVEGSPRRYLAPAGFRKRRYPKYDGRLRILAPLDPLIWDRVLIRQAFEFDYIWEVYKPAPLRRWGWYVCPLLHADRLVGRLEARIEEDVLTVTRLWRERGSTVNNDELNLALERHAVAAGAARVLRPRRFEIG